MRRRKGDDGARARAPDAPVADAAKPGGVRRAPSASANAFRRRDESPRQAASGLLLLLALAALARVPPGGDGGGDGGASFRRAAVGTLLFATAYCFLNARDGAMQRPHPGFWRALHGCNLWYAMVAAALLVARPEDGVVAVGWLFPAIDRTARGPMAGVGANAAGGGGGGGTLGTDHLDCSLTGENIRRQVLGLWFFAHAVGWWAKMLMLRDLWTCLVFSTAFELVELTLQVLVPEFQECWWDSVVLDWLVANLLIGMSLGALTRRLLHWPALNWAHDRPWFFRLRPVRLVTPGSWIAYDWNPRNDPVSLVLNAFVWVAMLVGEVNSFFLINLLQLPRDHAFNVLRQCFFCLTALPACEEWYEYTRHVRVYHGGVATAEYAARYAGRKPRIGQSTWLLTVTVGLETAAIAKYSRALGLFSRARAIDAGVWGPWAASAALFLGYFGVHSWLFYGGARRYPRWLQYLKWSSALPLLLLCRHYAF